MWQTVSRFIWETPQTIVGFLAAHGANMFGQVEDVSYFGGATVLQHRQSIGGAFTIGSYIQGGPTIIADPTTWLFQHEYGHYLQSRRYGFAYLNRFALPSLYSAAISDNKTWKHDNYEVERDANLRARDYWLKTVPGYKDSDWHYNFNPIDSDDKLLSPNWLDYTPFPSFVFYIYGIWLTNNLFGGNI